VCHAIYRYVKIGCFVLSVFPENFTTLTIRRIYGGKPDCNDELTYERIGWQRAWVPADYIEH